MQYTKILHDFSIFYPTYVFQTRCPEHLVELEGLGPTLVIPLKSGI